MKFLSKHVVSSALLVFAGAMGSACFADSIGPNCGAGNCLGSIYTLQNLGLQSTNATDNVYRIGLTIDTTSYTGSATDSIHSVAFKIASSVDAVSLVSTPVGTWVAQLGGNNANGCSGSGSGFVCAQDGTSVKADGSTYSWIFDVSVPLANSLFTGNLAASIKAEYDKVSGQNAGITSADITMDPFTPSTSTTPSAVPEPGSIILLGSMLSITCFSLRRKLIKS